MRVNPENLARKARYVVLDEVLTWMLGCDRVIVAAHGIRVLRVSYCLRIPSPWIGILASYFTTWSRHGNITSYPSAVEGRGIHPVIVDASTSALDGIHGTTLVSPS